MQGLSERTRQVVQEMQHEEVGQFLVAECGTNLPICDDIDEVGLERVRFAVLKLSNGDLDALLQAIQGAQTDWRNTFMVAGFGHDVTEHGRWANDYLAQS